MILYYPLMLTSYDRAHVGGQFLVQCIAIIFLDDVVPCSHSARIVCPSRDVTADFTSILKRRMATLLNGFHWTSDTASRTTESTTILSGFQWET